MYKFSAILKDVQLNIAAKAPSMLLSTASGAAGGWEGNWWGGNLKGLTLAAAKWYPDLIAFVASTGGVNVMTYDLSDDGAFWGCALPAAHASALSLSHTLSPSPNLPLVVCCFCWISWAFNSPILMTPRIALVLSCNAPCLHAAAESHYECPTPAICTLHDQVAFYMGTYSQAGISANVGYETGTPGASKLPAPLPPSSPGPHSSFKRTHVYACPALPCSVPRPR